MSDRKERLCIAFGEIDEKYIKEAESTVRTKTIIKAAVALVVVIGLMLFLFLPYASDAIDLSAYQSSEYYPLIEGLEEYRLLTISGGPKNNFQYITGLLEGLFVGKKNSAGVDLAPPPPTDNLSGNGNYVEATDNQVEGVVESDLFKMTDKYIFRLGYKTVYDSPQDKYSRLSEVVRVYSIEKENTALVAEIELPKFEGEKNVFESEMFLSSDCNTLTIIKEYYYENSGSNIGVISLDVSDVNNISVKNKVSIEGGLNTSRMVDGKLILVTEFYFQKAAMDYSDPSSFVPTIDRGDGPECIKFEDIIYPEKITGTRYSVVAMLDEENLELLGANALLNFNSTVYISKNNIYITREYTKETPGQKKEEYISEDMSDIAVINYSGERLEECGVITVKGRMKDQYSFDELDGYLRVVTTTENRVEQIQGETVGFTRKRNVSLYIFDLADNSLAHKVEDFAIEGEEATAVRFRGDELYVCTAEVVNFTDPVYFFDLSNYENITYNDTGIIEGFSTSLIDLGEGFLLGIGMSGVTSSKVEIYEEQGDSVVSVDAFEFIGSYSTEYKSYLVNREQNIFGFAVDGYVDDDNANASALSRRYILLQFDGYKLRVLASLEIPEMEAYSARAAFIDGYLYITTNYGITVNRVY